MNETEHSVKRPTGPRLSTHECIALWEKAHLAGCEAAATHRAEAVPVTTTIVGIGRHERSSHGPDISDRSSGPVNPDRSSGLVSITQVEGVCSDFPCGFAWVQVRPANSAFGRWLVQNDRGRRDSYEGGVKVWVSDYGQSMGRKSLYAVAFARVLSAAGVNAAAGERMD